MKSTDIVAGQSYAYAPYGSSRNNPASAYTNGLCPITVTGLVKDRVKNTSTYGSRIVTLVAGTARNLAGEVVEVRVEARKIVCTWDEVLEARKQQAAWKAREQDSTTQRRNELDPVIARVEAALAAAGAKTQTRYLGYAYVHGITGEATEKRPAVFDTEPDCGGWENRSLTVETVIDREQAIKSGTIPVSVTLLDSLLNK